ncbi:MAG: YfhO family protein [Ruminococcus sp.]|nr:YfhO family protein [Ruminococcus sp.]
MTGTKTKAGIKPKKPKEQKGFKGFLGRNIFLILAFFIPFLLMFVFFAIKGVSPFGNKQILVTDLWHQYYPFLVDFQDKLQSGGSLLWTWRSGGGTNYVALMAYYLASPLNFLSVLVPASALREFLYVITCVKIGCAGLFFAWFLRMAFKKNDASITAFGILYALCAMVMGYYWNVIWLDTIALLPLVIAGTIALLKEGKFKLYIATLALSILANYYIGFFTCIFVMLVAIGYSITEFKSVKKLFTDFLKMVGCTAVAMMITAILVVPAYYALGHTHSSDNTFPATFAVNMGVSADFNGVLEGIGKTIGQTAEFVSPTTREGLPNVFSGVISIIFGILFFTNSKIKARERIYCGFLMVFFVLSFIIRQLDYIWHGFHFPNMLPHRFSFLFSFVLIYMAFRALMYIEQSKLITVLVTLAGFIAMVVIAAQYDETKAIIATVIVGFIVFAWLILFVLEIVPKSALVTGVFIIALAEAACSAYIGIQTVTVTDASYYPLGTDSTMACVDYINEAESSRIDLERTEVTKYYTLNDDALEGFDGISMFNSMTNKAITAYMEKFGICGWIASNRYTYQESSPFTNLMLNIKYLISPYDKYLDTTHNSLLLQESGVKLLENEWYIPQGFVTSRDLNKFTFNTMSDNPIDNQNKMFSLATGIEANLYEYLEVVNQGHTDYAKFPVNKSSYGNYTFSTSDDSGETPHVKFNYEAPYDGVAVAYFTASGSENVTLKVNDTDINQNYVKRPYIMTFGSVKQGDKLSVYSDIKDTKSGSITVYCAMMNEDVFRQGYEQLSKSVFSATKVTDDNIEGIINVEEDGLFYTSISYVDGWKAYVDGEEVEIKPVGGAMLAFDIDKGSHVIKLKYTPEGWTAGILISVVGVLIFAAMITLPILLKRRKIKAPSKPVTKPEAAAKETTEAKGSDDEESLDEV